MRKLLRVVGYVVGAVAGLALLGALAVYLINLSIAGAYDLGQFKTMLRTGVGPGNKNIGMMGEVARSDFSHLTDEEIAAVHAYLVERAQRTP